MWSTNRLSTDPGETHHDDRIALHPRLRHGRPHRLLFRLRAYAPGARGLDRHDPAEAPRGDGGSAGSARHRRTASASRNQAGPYGARARRDRLMERIFYIVLAVLGGGLIVLLVADTSGTMSEIESSRFGNLVYL